VQSLKLTPTENGSVFVAKQFSFPGRVPFDMSDGNFAITAESGIKVAGDAIVEGERLSQRERKRGRDSVRSRDERRRKVATDEPRDRARRTSREPEETARPRSDVKTDTKMRTMSVSAEGTFYLYSFDGKLLAEYNKEGVSVKDYIYMGNRLIAEYQPSDRPGEDKFYYYTSDQINSTRIVTDQLGNVVYSVAHDPYGGIQKEWETVYDPMPKFSGKERDTESQLDYFGARYYEREHYRFISVDPILHSSLFNAQRMNLYSLCMNNPISFVDPDGKALVPICLPLSTTAKNVYQYLDSEFFARLCVFIQYMNYFGVKVKWVDFYRTLPGHKAMQESGNFPAISEDISDHCSGFAADMSFIGLSAIQRVVYVPIAAYIAELKTGVNFRPISDPNHIYMDPPNNNAYAAELAAIAFDLWVEWYNFSADPMDIYMRYGVFTIAAAAQVVENEIAELYKE
jgi:RHS repeat-associated protein